MNLVRILALLSIISAVDAEESCQIRLFHGCDLIYQIASAEDKKVSYVTYEESDDNYRTEEWKPFTAYAWFAFDCTIERFVGMAGRASDIFLETNKDPDLKKSHSDAKSIRVFVRSRGIGVDSLDTPVPLESHVPEFKLAPSVIIGIKDRHFGLEWIDHSPKPTHYVVTATEAENMELVKQQIDRRISDAEALAKQLENALETNSNQSVVTTPAAAAPSIVTP